MTTTVSTDDRATRRPATPAPAAGPLVRHVYDSPVGPLVLTGDEAALTRLDLPPLGPRAGRPRGEGADGGRPEPGVVGLPGPLTQARAQLAQYFAGTRRHFELALRPTGTPFQLSVWWALADIDYGDTISYAELARRVGRPRAFRAVGQANGANPLPIVLPCHRVVASGGGIGGYGGGLTLKRRLLDLEAGTTPD
jgi:methylated-DNA-[protein]-cysteine S-methyltransferase